MADESYDVIVIGAGFGGSSCAGLLAKKGLRVLLTEKNAQAGGKAMSLSKNGHTYTTWVVIGAPVEGNYYQKLLDELEVADLATLAIPGTQGSIYRNPDGKYEMLPTLSTGQTDPNPIFEWLGISEAERPAALEFFIELTLMPPEKVRELSGSPFETWIASKNVPRSLYAFLVSLCCDGMFMVPPDSLDAAEAISSLQDMFLRGGGVFCEGGFGRVAEAYCEAVRRNGGTVLMRNRTERILVEGGRAPSW
jgi:phytoene dehydrogenase-like protein